MPASDILTIMGLYGSYVARAIWMLSALNRRKEQSRSEVKRIAPGLDEGTGAEQERTEKNVRKIRNLMDCFAAARNDAMQVIEGFMGFELLEMMMLGLISYGGGILVLRQSSDPFRNNRNRKYRRSCFH